MPATEERMKRVTPSVRDRVIEIFETTDKDAIYDLRDKYHELMNTEGAKAKARDFQGKNAEMFDSFELFSIVLERMHELGFNMWKRPE